MEQKFTSTLIQINSTLWNLCLMVPDDVVTFFTTNHSKRVICTLDNKHTFHCALMPSGKGTYFINVNKAIRKKLGLEPGNSCQVVLVPDNTKYGMPICDEFKTALELDEHASTIFHGLTPGKQRSLIHLIGIPKSPEIRIKKSLTVLSYLVSVNGKLDFKELHQALKDAQ